MTLPLQKKQTHQFKNLEHTEIKSKPISHDLNSLAIIKFFL